MAEGGDFYAVLGVPKDASDKDIKRAFRQLARECHPDVAGNDPAKTERFKALREAYETLSDENARAAYDRRHERRSSQSPFYGSHWRHAGSPAGGVGNKATAKAGNDIDLEDIFNDFGGVDLGVGRGGARAGRPPAGGPASPGGARGPTGGRPRTTAQQWDPMRDFKAAAAQDSWPGAGEGGGAPGGSPGAGRPAAGNGAGNGPGSGSAVNPGAPGRGFGFSDGGWSTGNRAGPAPGTNRRPEPDAGDDVHVEVAISSALLGIGGLVTVEYDRNVRADDGYSLLSVKELHELRVPPEFRDGDELRVPKHGHAGPGGGPYGDLVAKVRLVGAGPRMKMPRAAAAEPAGTEEGVIRVEVPFTEAILGGRVEVETPQGRVRISIPAGTSSGVRFRLKGKGKADAAGQPGDAYAEVMVTVPKTLDEESRKLIERFSELNPGEG